MRTCSVPDCDRKHYAHDYCRLHGRRVASFGQTDLPTRQQRPECSVSGCNRTVRAREYCNTHNERLRRNGSVEADRPIRPIRVGEPCDLDGCEEPHYCQGFCVNHYQQRVSKPRRRALKAVAVGNVTAEQIQARVDYFGGRCWMCPAPWTCIDHVKPLAAGGSNWAANLRPACRSCNARKQHHWPYPTTTRKAA